MTTVTIAFPEALLIMLYRAVELSTLQGKSRGGKNAMKALEQYFKRSAICKLHVSFLHFK